MRYSKRDSKRAKTMRSIQLCALDLFDKHGFNSVTVEDIAEKSGVSASTIYRYFSTKERILLAEDFDVIDDKEMEILLSTTDIPTLIRHVSRHLDERKTPDPARTKLTKRIMRYRFDEPSVRQAHLDVLQGYAKRLIPFFQHSLPAGELTKVQATVGAYSLVFAYFSVLEYWYENGMEQPIDDIIDEALATLEAKAGRTLI